MSNKIKYSKTIVSSSESDSDGSDDCSLGSLEGDRLENITSAALMEVSDEDSGCGNDTLDKQNFSKRGLYFIDKHTEKANPTEYANDSNPTRSLLKLEQKWENDEKTKLEKPPLSARKEKFRKSISKRGMKEIEKSKGELSSTIQDSLASHNLYINTDVYHQCTIQNKMNPKSESKPLHSISRKNVDTVLKKSVLPSDLERQHTIPPYEVSLHTQRLRRREERSKTKGKEWFNMSAPEMTDELKNDLAILKMRHVLDPKRFYKRPDLKVLPKFFQTGKIVADATDFYSSRVPKKQQKKNLVDELLEDAEFKKYSKRKYAEIMEKRQQNRKYKGAAKHMKRLKKKKK